jgi:hypothetical protein
LRTRGLEESWGTIGTVCRVERLATSCRIGDFAQ